jgi:hypothetical protein
MQLKWMNYLRWNVRFFKGLFNRLRLIFGVAGGGLDQLEVQD